MSAKLTPPGRAEWTRIRRIEARLGPLCIAARQLLSVACPENGASERARLRDVLLRGELPQPQWQPATPRKVTDGFRVIDELRREVEDTPGATLFADKLDELELDLALLDAVGDARRVRPLSRRRFPCGDDVVSEAEPPQTLGQIAREWLAYPAQTVEARTLPARAQDEASSLERVMREVARAATLDVTIEVEPRLAAGAATGERTIYLADRRFGVREAVRLAVHEVLGHLTVAANGRAQPFRLLEWGTAGSFADQEGVAIFLEDQYGVLDTQRLRTLAGRVVATDCVRGEWSFGEAARHLHQDHGFTADEAIALCERAFRGGGIARDASYLLGYIRVRNAIEGNLVSLDELRMGRVSLDAIAPARALIGSGYARRAVYRPNLSRSFLATISGTTLDTSPPKIAASFTRLELT